MKHQLLMLTCFALVYFASAQNDYFWIGGQGDWSDLENWNLENGIVPNGLPDATTNVYFNEDSFVEAFDTIFMNTEYPVCNNMFWENIPFEVVLSGDNFNSILQIYGSLKFHSNVINKYNGQVSFLSTQLGNEIEMSGNQFNNDIYFDGVEGEWTLLDDLNLDLYLVDSVFRDIYLNSGTLNFNGKQISCGSIISDNQSARSLNLENSEIILNEQMDYCWLVDMENLDLLTNNSSFYIRGVNNDFMTKNGNDIEFGNIYLQGHADTIHNLNNHIYYDYVQVDSNYCCFSGNYTIGSLNVNGQFFTLNGEPELDFLRVVTGMVVIPEGLNIGTVISDGEIIFSGSNHVNFAKLSHKACFYGDNTFDTLIITSSYGGYETSGGMFYFQSGQTQVVNDSLYMRGHPCENLTLQLIQGNASAFLKKDFGDADISCDFLIIANVAAVSETLDFYSGIYSSFVPDPYEPPPGWIYDDAPGYSYGIDGGPIYEACIGDTIVLTTENFNGNDSTLYYWNFDTVPGENYYLATESEEIYLRVVLAQNCYVDDILIMVFDSCENNIYEDHYNQTVVLYPNPTTGILNLQMQNITGKFEFVLSNAEGVIVFRDYISPNGLQYSTKLNLGEIEKGIYFANIKTNEWSVVKKVVLY